jgi:tRNA threonylcarbamoyladenosine biosynthesis protein TsaE
MEKLTMNSPEETVKFAQDFVENIEINPDGATVVCLYGDLGSGKTTFVKAAAEALGIKEIVTSPTFVIEKIYKLDTKKLKRLFHIDAYRLEEGTELLALGWNEIIANNENIIFIEWPKYVADVLPTNRHNLTFTFVDENTRTIQVA